MRKAITLIVKAAVSGLLLYFAFKSVDLGTAMARLGQIDFRWIGLGLLLLVVQVALVTLRWHQLILRCGAEIAFALAFRFSLIAGFFNQTLPSSVGGDAVRIWLVAKQSNWRAAAYSVLLDRVVGTVALAMMVVACLPWTFELVHNPTGRLALLVIGPGCIGAGLVFVLLGWERLSILQRWALTRHLAAPAAIGLAIFNAPRTLAAMFGLSFVIHFITAVAAWCAARSVGANLPLLYSVFLVLPVVLVTVVPISIAGWGVREAAMVAAFTYAGLPASDGLIVSLLFGAAYLALGIAGGITWIVTIGRAERRSIPAAALDG